MKKPWNGLLALGRTVAGLEARPREYRVVESGFPPRLGGERVPATTPVPPIASSPVNPPASASGEGEARGARPMARPFQVARPVAARSRSWRWFGWFRRRPVGLDKPEQIELRLEDVRPVRSSLAGEDFVVMKTEPRKRVPSGPNPFSENPKGPVAEAPAEGTGSRGAVRPGRWFGNRETSARS